MTLEKIHELGLIKDDTEVWVRKSNGSRIPIVAHGNWYQDDVLKYMHSELESFHWRDDNSVYLVLK